jgi:hypothetical protein
VPWFSEIGEPSRERYRSRVANPDGWSIGRLILAELSRFLFQFQNRCN